jgi:NAD-dependent dihydropyrimidine dehydrogenase PreA subunit
VVLYEGPGARPIEPARRLEMLTTLLDGGFRVTRTGPAGRFRVNAEAVIVLGEFEGGRPPQVPGLDGRGAMFRDVTDKCSCGTLQAVKDAREELQLPEPGKWVPWFPVLDYDRCAGCKQCADFCIFGVYEVSDDGQVRVTNPAKCKTNCPACARMCSQVAIIFPKFPSGPINGAEVDEEKVRAERAGSDLKKLLRGDAYNVLRRRGISARELAAEAGADVPSGLLKSLGADESSGGTEGAGETACCEDTSEGAAGRSCCCDDGADEVERDCCE